MSCHNIFEFTLFLNTNSSVKTGYSTLFTFLLVELRKNHAIAIYNENGFRILKFDIIRIFIRMLKKIH